MNEDRVPTKYWLICSGFANIDDLFGKASEDSSEDFDETVEAEIEINEDDSGAADVEDEDVDQEERQHSTAEPSTVKDELWFWSRMIRHNDPNMVNGGIFSNESPVFIFWV